MQDSRDDSNSFNPSGPSQPPPSYVPRDQDINSSEKVPTFPIPEVDNTGPFSANSSNISYYAPRSSTSSGAGLSPIPQGVQGAAREASPTSLLQPGPELLPSSFSRAPPAELLYSSFNPIFIVGQGKSLDKGFPAAPPPSNAQPHPFITHDVGEADWLSFLDAVRTAATLTEKDKRRSHLPIISIIPIVNGLSSLGIQAIMKHNKGAKIARTVDMWNHHFFGPRKMRVILLKGREKLSGLSASGDVTPAPYNLAPVTANDDVYRLIIVSI